jgi:hypothetical protein
MTAEAIQRVSRALQLRLSAALAANGLPSTVFVGPLDDQGANGASIVLFLYRVVTNADLRNTEHRVQPPAPNAPIQVHDSALPLDLYYLLTAGTLQTGGELEALGVLGYAIQALNDSPALVGVAVGGEPVRLSIDPVSCEEMSRIWSLFPTTNYRTSVVYLATPVWIDPAQPRMVAPPVTQEPHRFGQIPA